MQRAVDLHGKPRCQTYEVDKVRPNWDLTAKFVAGDLPASEPLMLARSSRARPRFEKLTKKTVAVTRLRANSPR